MQYKSEQDNQAHCALSHRFYGGVLGLRSGEQHLSPSQHGSLGACCHKIVEI